MSERKNGISALEAVKPAQDVIVEWVVISPKDAPVKETALVLSDAALQQLVLTAPLPGSK